MRWPAPPSSRALAQLDEDEAGLDLLEVLAAAVQAANDHLRAMVDANSSLDGMGTTLTAMLSSGTRLGLAHVGDSRAYLLRDGEFSQLTHDQTLVQRMVDEGRITPEQAETHPQRSLLTQALDGRAGVAARPVGTRGPPRRPLPAVQRRPVRLRRRTDADRRDARHPRRRTKPPSASSSSRWRPARPTT